MRLIVALAIALVAVLNWHAASALPTADFAVNLFREIQSTSRHANGVASVFTITKQRQVHVSAFWDEIQSFGERARRHAEDLLNDAVAVADTFTAGRIRYVQDSFNNILCAAQKLQGQIHETAQTQGISADDVMSSLESTLERLLEGLKEQFPPPDKAPTHAERKESASSAVRAVEETFVKFGREHGMEEESMRVHLDPLMGHFEDVIVTIGDLAEQHPALLEPLLVSGVFLMAPGAPLVRIFLRVFGFGPGGPVKGSLAAWAQRRFFGGYIPKGSWFAQLQRIGMTKGWQAVWGALKGALGFVGRLFGG